MSVARLNNVATQNGYVDALTVEFGQDGRTAFSLNTANAAIYYKLACTDPTGRVPVWESAEHFLPPTFNTFTNPVDEGFPQGVKFAGIQIRSAAAGVPANVTVM